MGAIQYSYAITAPHGCIPYVIECTDPCFDKPRKIFLDDFLYKNSFYDKNNEEEISKFIGDEKLDVIVSFRDNSHVERIRTLKSKRGNYKLTHDDYKRVLSRMKMAVPVNSEDELKVAKFADFNSGKLFLDGCELVEPKDLDDFNCGNYKTFGTGFINDLSEKAMLLYAKGGVLGMKSLSSSEFEYQKYLLSINEMLAYTFIFEHNYKVLHEHISDRNKSLNK